MNFFEEDIEVCEVETLQEDDNVGEVVEKTITKKSHTNTRRKHYINNKTMHNVLVDWLKELETNPKSKIPDYIGECFIKIAEGRAKHPWYNGWTFKDDMISEAVLTCIKYCRNYDPKKTENPFAYFTQFVNNAFEQVKQREKRLTDYKFEMIKEMQVGSDDFDYNNFFNKEEQ